MQCSDWHLSPSLSVSLLAPFVPSWPLPPHPHPLSLWAVQGAQLQQIWASARDKKLKESYQLTESATALLYPPPRFLITWADELRSDCLCSCVLRLMGVALKKTPSRWMPAACAVGIQMRTGFESPLTPLWWLVYTLARWGASWTPRRVILPFSSLILCLSVIPPSRPPPWEWGGLQSCWTLFATKTWSNVRAQRIWINQSISV